MTAEARHLTSDEVDELKAIVTRVRARRARAGRSGARVTRTDMTPEERQVRGAENDLRSALGVYERAEQAYESAKEEFLRAGDLLDRAKARMRSLGQPVGGD